MSNALRALVTLYLVLLACPLCLAEATQPATTNGPQILEEFGRQQPQRPGGVTVIADHEKQVIMFSIGTVLLVLLISTASVGIAVAAFGKELFLVHMILAGLTVTVALIHVVVGIVWFFPF
jgi:hypothetical protein